MSAVGNDQSAGGDPVPKLILEASEMGLARGAQDAVPPEPLYDGRRRVTLMVLEMEEYPIVGVALGRLLKSVALIAGGHEIFGTGDAPLEQGESLLVLVSPIQQVPVELHEPRGDVTLAGAKSVDAEDHARHQTLVASWGVAGVGRDVEVQRHWLLTQVSYYLLKNILKFAYDGIWRPHLLDV